MVDFAHLHVHTEYSLLDGACRIPALMDRVASLGQQHIAITDHGVMYGVIEFYRAAKAKGLHPIIGCEVYLAPASRHTKSYQNHEWHSHLILLCENETGYQNLMKLVSLGFTEGFYMRPRVDMELLRTYHEGLICLSACLGGCIPRLLMEGREEEATAKARTFAEIFGEHHFYLEIQNHGLAQQTQVNAGLYRIAEQTGIPLVATNDAHYLTKEDAKMQDVLMAVQMGKTVDDPSRMRFGTDELYIKSGEQMQNLFPDHPEAIANSVRIAERCQVEFTFGTYHLPVFDVPAPYTARTYLEKLCMEGLRRRYPNDDGTGAKRLAYEIDMIDQMGFLDYFLIVSDFIHFAKSKGIAVGPGRGSAAGSIVSYCLGITDLDPIAYSLYFERFLNPERVSMPDIDIDFCYMRRAEVIDYVTEKYGQDHVAQIVTFGTMAARGAIRDVGRALSIPYNEVDVIAKQIPNELHITIEKALTIHEDLKKSYDSDFKVRHLIDTARKLEGMPRNASTHAAGVVITNQPVDCYVPLAVNGEQPVTQFPMGTLEELGLLKMDFLGLRTLTVIQEAERMVRLHTPDFSIADVSLHDAPTFAMLGQGKTMGVFQLESAGITNVVTGLRPASIEDITAVVALYRPGPMQSIPRYIECRHDPSKVVYKHPLLEPILSVTYGCMVYQEQVMEVFRRLAGYSLGKADMVRRAMSKKKMKELEKERVNFIEGNEALGIVGAVHNGVDPQTAAEIFDQILDFANYAFNKAHAVSYALVSYRTAYLKCHYPKEYMAALLSSVLDASEKIAEYIAVAKEMGIAVCPPDVNASDDTFTVSGNQIHFGLSAIKNVGRQFMRHLVHERTEQGAFTSFSDFCERMSAYDMNRRALESLIKAGAFDTMGYRRSQLLRVFDRVLDSIAQKNKRNLSGQLDLFSLDTTLQTTEQLDLPDIPELSKRQLLTMEKETTGLYLSGHPLDAHTDLIQQVGAPPLRRILQDLSPEAVDHYFKDGMQVSLACVITHVKLKSTKNGSMMAYVTVEDASGSMELIVFSRAMQQCSGYLKEEELIFVQGKIDAREDEPPKMIASEIVPLTLAHVEALTATKQIETHALSPAQAQSKATKQLHLRVDTMDCEAVREVKALLSTQPGTTPVKFYPIDSGKKLIASRHLWVTLDLPLVEQLRFLLGKENVVIK